MSGHCGLTQEPLQDRSYTLLNGGGVKLPYLAETKKNHHVNKGPIKYKLILQKKIKNTHGFDFSYHRYIQQNQLYFLKFLVWPSISLLKSLFVACTFILDKSVDLLHVCM